MLERNNVKIMKRRSYIMNGFGQMIEKLKKDPKKIVFTEGTDERILEAASRLLAANFLHPILVGNKEEVLKAAEECGYNIRGAEIIDPANYERIDEMVDVYLAEDLVPGKQCLDDAEDIRVEAYELNDLLEMIYSGKMQDAKTVAAILAYACKVRE